MAKSRDLPPPADRTRTLRSGLRLEAIVFLYLRRLRRHPVQELLTGTGIAIGVALAFAVQIAGGSVGAGARNVVDGLAGRSTLQIASRGGPGLDPALAVRARRLPSVRNAAPVLEQPATLVGPSGRHVVVRLAGVDERLRALGGPLGDLAVGTGGLALSAVFLPASLAQRLGVRMPDTLGSEAQFPAWLQPPPWAGLGPPPPRVTSAPLVDVLLRGRSTTALVAATLGDGDIGALAEANIAGLTLAGLQTLAYRPDRVSRILVRPEPGQQTAARRDLRRLVGDTADVESIDTDARLLEQATAPTQQATTFFAAISGLVGFLLAFNAMLLTTPERRQVISDLRLLGFRRRQVATILLFQATVLGIVGSIAGLFLGGLLSRELLHATPDYLATAFPLSTQNIVALKPILVTLAGGMIATYLAALPPLLDLRHGRALDAAHHRDEPASGIAPRTSRWCLGAALLLLVVSAVLLAAVPSAAFAAGLGVAAAALFVLPAVFPLLVSATQIVSARFAQLNTLTMALMGLRTTTARSLALAATGAIAVFGSVAVGGAHHDLLEGLSSEYRGYVSSADLWIAPPHDSLATTSFPAAALAARVRNVPGVAAVRGTWGGYLDMAGRRVWVQARSPGDDPLIPPGQIVRGDQTTATDRVNGGGWITVSETIAKARNLSPSDTLRLPTPTGVVPFRIAATTTNLGWSPGAIVMNAADYVRDWGSADPTALQVDVAPNADAVHVERGVRAALGPGTGLQVQTATRREAEAVAMARQGLDRLSQISVLLLAAAALAMASAMGAAMWQRRRGLAGLRLQSFRPRQLWGILLVEAAVVLAAGCLTGAVFGLAGQALIDLYLRESTGFPATFTISGAETLQRVLLVVGAALLVLSVPGYFASRAPARIALQE